LFLLQIVTIFYKQNQLGFNFFMYEVFNQTYKLQYKTVQSAASSLHQLPRHCNYPLDNKIQQKTNMFCLTTFNKELHCTIIVVLKQDTPQTVTRLTCRDCRRHLQCRASPQSPCWYHHHQVALQPSTAGCTVRPAHVDAVERYAVVCTRLHTLSSTSSRTVHTP